MATLRALGFLAAAAIAAPTMAPSVSAQGSERVVYAVAPNEADPTVGRFLRSSLVLFDRDGRVAPPLLLFLPGTGGNPAGVRSFLNLAVDVGYRVISLAYNNLPAAMQACARDPDPACSANFRQRRLFGDPTPSSADDQPAESIVNRLTRLLQFLDGNHPGDGWGAYLANGAPDWNRIAVAGHSQGGGMAAFLAKRTRVARVILFSGPADFVPAGRQPAPWLAMPSTTPSERWYGLYHREEALAPLLRQAYGALGLAPDHVRVLGLAPGGPVGTGGFPDAFHVSVVADRLIPRAPDGSPAYAADWAFLLGSGR
jgi:acetyl esterase/lipase